MQVQKPQLERQQLILKALGYYAGPIDGIWGPASIEAMKKFASSPKFRPGIPNNGLPFRERPPYPSGITLGFDGLLYHDSLAPFLKKAEPDQKVTAPVVEQSSPNETPVETHASLGGKANKK